MPFSPKNSGICVHTVPQIVTERARYVTEARCMFSWLKDVSRSRVEDG